MLSTTSFGNQLRGTPICQIKIGLIAALAACGAVGLHATTVYSNPMNSGPDVQINSNVQFGASGTLSYVATGGSIGGGFQQLAVDSTNADLNQWYAGLGIYGQPGTPSPIQNTIPAGTSLSAISFTFDGLAAGGNPLNVGVRVEAWNATNSVELGFFYLVPLTLDRTGTFQSLGGSLDTFGFVAVAGGIASGQDAVNQATDWRFNYSFAGTILDPISADNAAPTYGHDNDNVLGIDNVNFQFGSSVPEPATGMLVPFALLALTMVRARSLRTRAFREYRGLCESTAAAMGVRQKRGGERLNLTAKFTQQSLIGAKVGAAGR